MYPRDIRVNDPSEALIVERALAMYREMKQAADAAPDGTVFDVADSLAVARGREFTRKSLEVVLHDQAEAVEKRGSRPNLCVWWHATSSRHAIAQGQLGGGAGDAAARLFRVSQLLRW